MSELESGRRNEQVNTIEEVTTSVCSSRSKKMKAIRLSTIGVFLRRSELQ